MSSQLTTCPLEICPLSETSVLYNEIMSLNNIGTTNLMAGELEEASISLTRALSLANAAATTAAASAASSRASVAASPPRRMVPRIACVFASEVRSSSDERFSSSTSRCPFVYQQPIQLSESLELTDPNTPGVLITEARNVEAISYTVIYNIALCRHLHAMALSGTRDVSQKHEQVLVRRSYLQAASLYADAQSLLIQHCKNIHRGSENQHHMGTLHNLTILNNLGHVFGQVGNISASQKCFDALFKAIICINTSGAAMIRETCVLQGSAQQRIEAALDGFLSNILCYWVASSNIAPAA